ncbi:MAG: ABC transporter permease [Bacteroidales bacterium]|nr:ABC transporter permease [Bacteroidales bacterium]
MQFEQLIAKRFLHKEAGSFSSSLVKIATITIALSVLVMIMSVAILRGFQREIQQKVVGFGSHVVVKSQYLGNQYMADPINRYRDEVERIQTVPGVRHLQFFADKGGMLKTDNQIHGIILKGVDSSFDTTFFAQNLIEGRLFQFNDSSASNEIIISSTIAAKMGLSIGDKARTYFWQSNSPRGRAFKVVGIYNTDLSEFDEHYMVGDLRQVQKLNEWNDSMVAGYEILVDDFKHLTPICEAITATLGFDLTAVNIVDQNPSLFAWLDLLNNNIVFIILVMAIVCMVAVISAFLIMIFEKTSMIGVLKTLGANNRSIKEIFLRKSLSIIGKGLLIGNGLALLLCWIQQQFHIVKLDSESYSMNFVPIDLNPWYFLIISLGTLLCCLLALLVPTGYISKIDPAKSIRVE